MPVLKGHKWAFNLWFREKAMSAAYNPMHESIDLPPQPKLTVDRNPVRGTVGDLDELSIDVKNTFLNNIY